MRRRSVNWVVTALLLGACLSSCREKETARGGEAAPALSVKDLQVQVQNRQNELAQVNARAMVLARSLAADNPAIREVLEQMQRIRNERRAQIRERVMQLGPEDRAAVIRVADLERELADLAKERRRLDAEFSAARNQAEAPTSEKRRALEREREQLQQELQKLRADYRKLLDQFSRDPAMQAIKTETAEAEARLQKQIDEHLAGVPEKAALDRERAELQQQIERVKADPAAKKQAAREEMAKIEHAISRQIQDLRKTNADVSRLFEQRQQLVRENRRKINDMLAGQNKQAHALITELNRLERERDGLSEEIARISKEYRAALARIKASRAAPDKARAETEKARAAYESARAEPQKKDSALRERLAELETGRRKLLAGLKDHPLVKAGAQDIKKVEAALEDELRKGAGRALLEQRDALRRQAEPGQIQEKLAAVEARMAEFMIQAAKQDSRLAALRSQAAQAGADGRKKIDQYIARQNPAARTLMERLQQLKTKSAAVTQELTRLRAGWAGNVQKLKEEHDRKRKVVDAAADKLKAELAAAQAVLARYENELTKDARVQVLNKAAQSQLAALRNRLLDLLAAAGGEGETLVRKQREASAALRDLRRRLAEARRKENKGTSAP